MTNKGFIEDENKLVPKVLEPYQKARFVEVYNSAIAKGKGQEESLKLANESLLRPKDRLPSNDEGFIERGGPGSGHHGHRGRPGKVGGSLPRESGLTRPIQTQMPGVSGKIGAVLIQDFPITDVVSAKEARSWEVKKNVSFEGLSIDQIKQTENALRHFYRRTGVKLGGYTITDEWDIFAKNLILFGATGPKAAGNVQALKAQLLERYGDSLSGAHFYLAKLIFINNKFPLDTPVGLQSFYHEISHYLVEQWALHHAIDLSDIRPSNVYRGKLKYYYPDSEIQKEYLADLVAAHVIADTPANNMQRFAFRRGGMYRPLNRNENLHREEVMRRIMEASMTEIERELSERAAEMRIPVLVPIFGGYYEFRMFTISALASARPGTVDLRSLMLKGIPTIVSRGGPGSGHFDHEGRPGEVGGSLPSGAAGIDFYEYQDKNIEHIPKKMGKSVPQNMDYRPGRWLGLHAEGTGDVFREIAKSQKYNFDYIDWGYIEEKLIRLEGDINDKLDQELLFEGKLSDEDEARRQRLLKLWKEFPGDMPPALDIARNLNLRLLERDLTGTILAIRDVRAVKEMPTEKLIQRGGPGSGHHGHRGRPGEVGGSLPSGAAGPSKPLGKTEVGITSAKPGKPSRQVFNEMRKFEDRLKKLRTVRNPSVKPGLGGWEGGREPTWIVSYEGNGQAIREIAKTAKKFDQDAVLFMREASGRGGSPIVTWRFTDPVTPEERDAVENLLIEMGIGGWTWFRTPDGHSSLKAVAIPQWGGDPQKHLSSSRRLRQLFQSINMPHEYEEGRVEVDILQREGENAYDEILGG
jgi:hypothetical protein